MQAPSQTHTVVVMGVFTYLNSSLYSARYTHDTGPNWGDRKDFFGKRP